MNSTTLLIGEAARASGLSEDTLRYYERIGLLPHIEREANGHRRYTERDLMFLEFIVRMRGTGMPLETLQRYVELVRAENLETTREERRTLLEDHARKVEAQISDLQRTLEIVQNKLDRLNSRDCAPESAS